MLLGDSSAAKCRNTVFDSISYMGRDTTHSIPRSYSGDADGACLLHGPGT